jgi:CRP-like cAMP-binding protein
MTLDLAAILQEAGVGRRVVQLKPRQNFFTQGSSADSIFYLETGRAKLIVVSPDGREATLALLSAGDFMGEESLAPARGRYTATATAMVTCKAIEIGRDEMLRVLQREPALSEIYLKFLLARTMRTQADLVDQLFNSSEKRLARILLLMADIAEPGKPDCLLPRITQEALAEMVGTTRGRVSFFMNRFRKLGFIDYNGRIRVYKALINVILYDQVDEGGAGLQKAAVGPAKESRRQRGR